MAACDILKELREKHNLTQEELAERVLVTRQAVSRWETGETQPNTETLKLLSREYDVSINTLTRTTANGVIRMENMYTRARRPCSIS